MFFWTKRNASQVKFRRICDHRPPHARLGTLHLRLELPSVQGEVQQPPVLHNNRACCPDGVATRSQLHCAILLGTARSRTDEFRMTNVLPLRHPRQQDDIFRLPQTAPGMFGPCASSHQRVLQHPWWLPLPWRCRPS